jgi:pre-mRNA-splicing factor 18
MYVFWKKYMFDWESYLANLPSAQRMSDEGKAEMALQRQTAEHLKPFFKRLKEKKMEKDVAELIAEICHWIYQREYVNANDAYLRLSIGNSAWPIGVTAVSFNYDYNVETNVKVETVLFNHLVYYHDFYLILV